MHTQGENPSDNAAADQREQVTHCKERIVDQPDNHRQYGDGEHEVELVFSK